MTFSHSCNGPFGCFGRTDTLLFLKQKSYCIMHLKRSFCKQTKKIMAGSSTRQSISVELRRKTLETNIWEIAQERQEERESVCPVEFPGESMKFRKVVHLSDQRLDSENFQVWFPTTLKIGHILFATLIFTQGFFVSIFVRICYLSYYSFCKMQTEINQCQFNTIDLRVYILLTYIRHFFWLS